MDVHFMMICDISQSYNCQKVILESLIELTFINSWCLLPVCLRLSLLRVKGKRRTAFALFCLNKNPASYNMGLPHRQAVCYDFFQTTFEVDNQVNLWSDQDSYAHTPLIHDWSNEGELGDSSPSHYSKTMEDWLLALVLGCFGWYVCVCAWVKGNSNLVNSQDSLEWCFTRFTPNLLCTTFILMLPNISVKVGPYNLENVMSLKKNNLYVQPFFFTFYQKGNYLMQVVLFELTLASNQLFSCGMICSSLLQKCGLLLEFILVWTGEKTICCSVLKCTWIHCPVNAEPLSLHVSCKKRLKIWTAESC